MAKTKATAERLTMLAQQIKDEHDHIQTVKQAMDKQLEFPWNDPVGQNFVIRYREDFKPIENKLMPNMVSYTDHLNVEAAHVEEFNADKI